MVPLDLEVALQFEKFDFVSGPRFSDAADLNPEMDGDCTRDAFAVSPLVFGRSSRCSGSEFGVLRHA
jgi:hypothetical protein